MATTVLCQPLSFVGKTLSHILRSWSVTQGHVARCVSNHTASLVGSQDNHRSTATSQQLAFSVALSQSNPLNESRNTAFRSGTTSVPLASSDVEMALEQRLARLTLTPLESRLSLDLMLHALGPQAPSVVDPSSPLASLRLGCPTAAPLVPLCDPASTALHPGEEEAYLPARGTGTRKKASNILHKRRRKMNRHQYLKWKKRNKFKLRIQKQRSRKKKKLKWEQHLAQFRFTGLRPGEGEEYLAKQREKAAIYLRYLGIKTEEEEAAEKEKKTGQALKVGRVVPERPLPQGAKM